MVVVCNKSEDECMYLKNCWHGKPHKPSESSWRACGEGTPCPIFDTAICIPAGDEEDIT